MINNYWAQMFTGLLFYAYRLKPSEDWQLPKVHCLQKAESEFKLFFAYACLESCFKNKQIIYKGLELPLVEGENTNRIEITSSNKNVCNLNCNFPFRVHQYNNWHNNLLFKTCWNNWVWPVNFLVERVRHGMFYIKSCNKTRS